MKIGLLVEGDSEYHALPYLIPRIATEDVILVRPLRAPMHPLAPVGALAQVAASRARIWKSRGADRIVLLLDNEGRLECPGRFALSLARELKRQLGAPSPDVFVVMKVQAFENWLVADTAAISTLQGLFEPPSGFASHIAPDRADNVDARRLLQQWSRRGHTYEKVETAQRICAVMDPLRAGRNSRSFRRLLRVLGNSAYREQSRMPVG